MWSTAREISDGDLVIIWMTRDMLQPLVITAGKELNNRFGVYRHADLIGMSYGSKVGSRNGKGFIHVLRPTPELWTLALPHRTQILYLADIAFVTSWLDVKPGSKVIEAGTGSGSFSHSTARTIGPTGHLWSYEFHEARAGKAREEFTRHGMDDIVTLTHRNVCKDGFTVEDTVDSVFLDLPAPWEAIAHAKKALRKDRPTRICCFSPCMEQVMRTVTSLNDHGFSDITMYETLQRPHQVDVIPAPPSVRSASTALKRAELRRETKRLRQIAQAHRGTTKASGKRKREDAAAAATESKRAKTDESDDAAMVVDAPIDAPASTVDTPFVSTDAKNTAQESGAMEEVKNEEKEAEDEEDDEEEGEPAKISLSKMFPEVRGHTSYLTFAVLFPPIPSVVCEAAPDTILTPVPEATTPAPVAA